MVRSPMQVDNEFRLKMKKIQEMIMKKRGQFESIPNITKKIVRMPEWNIIESRLLSDLKQLEIKINFDRSFK